MKAFLLDKPGAPETLRLGEAPLPIPAEGQIRVRVEAVSLNPVDYKVAARGNPHWTFPFILGLDVAGTIDAIGPDVTGFKTGERVYYHGDLRKRGGYAEYALADAAAVGRIPANVSSVQAAGLPTAGFTAWQCLFERARLDKGRTVLIHGGSGGVGGFGVQMAHRAGFQTLSTASPKNADRVKALGAGHVIDYNSDVAAAVREITKGRGVDMVVDTVGGESATRSIGMLAFGGHLVCVVGLPDFSAWQPFTKGMSVHEISLGAAYSSGDPRAVAKLGEMANQVVGMVSRGELDHLVGLVVPFEELPTALGKLHRREVPSGKVVVKVADLRISG